MEFCLSEVYLQWYHDPKFRCCGYSSIFSSHPHVVSIIPVFFWHSENLIITVNRRQIFVELISGSGEGEVSPLVWSLAG